MSLCPVCSKKEIPEGISVCETCANLPNSQAMTPGAPQPESNAASRKKVWLYVKSLRSAADKPADNEVRAAWLEKFAESVTDIVFLLQHTGEKNILYPRIYKELIARAGDPTDYKTTIVKLRHINEKDNVAIDTALASYDAYAKKHGIEIGKRWFEWHQITLSVRSGTYAKVAAIACLAEISTAPRHWRSVRQMTPDGSPLYNRACAELKKFQATKAPPKPRTRSRIVNSNEPPAPKLEIPPEQTPALPDKAREKTEWPVSGKTRDLFDRIAAQYASEGLATQAMVKSLRGFLQLNYHLSLGSIGTEENLLDQNYSGLAMKEQGCNFTIPIGSGKRQLRPRLSLTFTTIIQNGRRVMACRWM